MIAIRTPLVLLTLLIGSAATRAVADTPLFPADPAAAVPLDVELHMPMSQHRQARSDAELEIEAKLVLADGSELPLSVQQRGKSRVRQCDYYPLWLDFKKKAATGTVFEGQNKLKLVTHCSEKLAPGGFLAAEMLAYRLLNMLTDASFRVRALNLTYVDTERDWRKQRPAFLIEHKKQLSERLQGEEVDIELVAPEQLAGSYAALIGLFQLMIGNTDYSLRQGPPGELCCHNAVAIERDGEIWSVPYDFDVSGLVNPPYARPQPALGIRRVTSRLYRGYCVVDPHVQAAGELIAANQDAIFALVEAFDDLPGLRAKRITNFLRGYFKIWENPATRSRDISGKCLG